MHEAVAATNFAALTTGWRDALVATLDRLLAGQRRVVLLDCPDHGNVGDSLIGLGELLVLERMGCRFVDVASSREYGNEAWTRHLGDAAILIHGGGNFGDLWPEHQRFRERLATSFPNNLIVQLPQSVHFGSSVAAEQSADVLRAHRQFVLLCRDRESLARAHGLGLRAELTPDMALALPALGRTAAATHPVSVVRRSDHEAANGPLPRFPERWHQEDWIRDVPWVSRERKRARTWRRRLPLPASAYIGRWTTRRAFDARKKYGLDIISKGEVVITDRLHVHVLCCLSGVRHAFVDNNYGKLSSFWNVWTKDVPTARRCDTWDEAIAWAAGEAPVTR